MVTGRLACVLLGGLAAAPCGATEHLMVVQELFVGPPADGVATGLAPDARAQYAMLRMTAMGQSLVHDSPIRIEDADGNLLGSFGTFPANVADAGSFGCIYPNCPALILGTAAARAPLPFPFDAVVDGQPARVALPVAGGRACFLSNEGALIDCVAWGNFDCRRSGHCAGRNTARLGDESANGCDVDFGAPAAPGGLRYGFALARRAFDCLHKDNLTQFVEALPRPTNNGGASAPDADGDGLADAFDCADADPSLLWPATEVQGLRANEAQQFVWTAQSSTAGTGVRYDVVRGTLGAVDGFLDAACHAADTPSAAVADAATPPAGQGVYYLARAGAGTACVAGYGPGRDALAAICP